MNIQALRAIDSVMGLAVFLLLVIAIIAGQGRDNLSLGDTRMINSQFQPEAVVLPTSYDRRTMGQFSEMVDRMNTLQTGVDLVLDSRNPAGSDKRSAPIND
ncbi:MAG: hypothetical protein OEW68_01310 [Gammaproteobacteria bacterium]|nr:hypothetical protein [Gammaproteobacteria bacterium]MDH4313462.1 hypothetical protein [Gammaproteobacteria bacterium]MDH5213038.1 hypothetical protein [Gammaproteobacteria bacterium]MDH5499812.1 hypothetical protein [Gammaproteobacteria bacterium]